VINAKTPLYRFLETIPGLLTWGTFIFAVILSYYVPAWVAVFIILFDLYWMFKAVNIGLHLMHSYKIMSIQQSYDWPARCLGLANIPRLVLDLQKKLSITGNKWEREAMELEIEKLRHIAALGKTSIDFRKYYHLIFLPMVHESFEVISASIDSYLASDFPRENLLFVLATEERAGAHAQAMASQVSEKYGNLFGDFLVTVHPEGIEGEAKTKGANLTNAALKAKNLLDERGIAYGDVIVSAFDADTIIKPFYFSQLTYIYATTENPGQASYQPVAMYHNNVWETPAMNRVAAVSNSFWLMIESSRPDRLVTFSSHSMSFETLVAVNYWPVDVIPEDSQIFWKCFLHFNGNYRVVPLYTTVSLDAVSLENYVASLVAQYKQYRRWAWGVVDFPYVVYGFLHNKRIPLWKRFIYSFRLLEGHYFWATAAVTIAFLGWLPLLLGGERFNNEVFAFNLPFITGFIMTVATIFLIFSVVINFQLLPNRPKEYSSWRSAGMFLQWLLVPVASVVIHALPAIDAQTRLLFGRYMEFWVTPKVRHAPTKTKIV